MRRTQSHPPLSLGEKSERLGRQVRAERLRTLARLERVLPIQDAEDAYQDACVRALERLNQQKGEASFRGWFHAVVRSAVATHARGLRNRSPEQADIEELHLFSRADQGDICRCGLRALERARPNYRSVLRRAILDSQPVKEIGAQDRTTPNNVRVRLHRARAGLRDCWTDICGPCITVDAGTNCICVDHCDGRSP